MIQDNEIREGQGVAQSLRVLKSELTSSLIKKELGAYRVVQRWHNKNKTGGNFGINIYFADEFNRDTDMEICGSYNASGELNGLSFGYLYSAGSTVPKIALNNLVDLFSWIKGALSSYRADKKAQISQSIKDEPITTKEERK